MQEEMDLMGSNDVNDELLAELEEIQANEDMAAMSLGAPDMAMASPAMGMAMAAPVMPYAQQPSGASYSSVEQSMESLIQSQESEGCWKDFSVILSYVTYHSYSAFNSFLSKNSDIKDIVTTVLALQFLE